MAEGLDCWDRRILDVIQEDFPLVSRPYAAIGERIGLGEDEVFRRVGRLRASGHIRRIGANFDSRRLGWRSTLAAARVPEEKLEAFIGAVNAREEVTHNYLRDHAWNVWFTVTARDEDALAAVLEAITRETGIPVTSLPASAVYKIRVKFPMEEKNGPGNADSWL